MKNWSKADDDKIVSLFMEGKTYVYICNELGVTDGALRSRLRKIGVKKSVLKIRSKKCLNCDCEFNFSVNSKKERNKKFCSNSCSTSYNNNLRSKAIVLNCKNCGLKLDKSIKKYCDNKCQGEHKRRLIFEKIKNGDTNLYEKQYKNFLINEYGNKCMDCGWCEINKYTGKVPIQLEHIDGNSDNNSLNNLRLLCPNCHSLTSTYGALNKGNGRTKRKANRIEYRDKKVD